MKRTILVFGLIAGIILSIVIFASVPWMRNMTAESMGTSMFVGYAVQLLTFSLIFFAVKQYRDKHNGGLISFGKAFRIGILISLIGSAFYVITWAIAYNYMIPDFMDIWERCQLEAAMNKGASAQEIAKIKQEVADGKEIYSTWWGFAGFTFLEIFPTGIVVSLISALILKRKRRKEASFS